MIAAPNGNIVDVETDSTVEFKGEHEDPTAAPDEEETDPLAEEREQGEEAAAGGEAGAFEDPKAAMLATMSDADVKESIRTLLGQAGDKAEKLAAFKKFAPQGSAAKLADFTAADLRAMLRAMWDDKGATTEAGK